MCLSTVYTFYGKDNDHEDFLCEYVSGVDADGNRLTFRDILGSEITVTGALKHVDLVKNKITVELSQPLDANRNRG
jgi:predicted RNA-binding protein